MSPQKTVSSLFPQPLSSTVYTRLYGFDSSRDLLDCKEFQPVNLKGNQSWIYIGSTDAETETPILWPHDAHLKRPSCWERVKAGGEENDRGWDGWISLPTLWTWVWVNSGDVGDGQGGLVCCSPRGFKESDTTEQLNWTEGPLTGPGGSDGKEACVRVSHFLCLNDISLWIFYEWISLDVTWAHLSVCGHLGCCSLLVGMTTAAMNLGGQISFWVPAFHYLGCVLRYVIAGSIKSSCVYLWNGHTASHGSCTGFHSHWCMRVLVFSTLSSTLVFITAALMGVKW